MAKAGKLPVVLFTAGGLATPADAAMMMQLGAEGVFVGSGIFKSGDPAKRAAAIVKATTFYDDPDVIAKVSRGLGEADGRHQHRHAPVGPALRLPRLVTRGAGSRSPARSVVFTAAHRAFSGPNDAPSPTGAPLPSSHRPRRSPSPPTMITKENLLYAYFSS